MSNCIFNSLEVVVSGAVATATGCAMNSIATHSPDMTAWGSPLPWGGTVLGIKSFCVLGLSRMMIPLFQLTEGVFFKCLKGCRLLPRGFPAWQVWSPKKTQVVAGLTYVMLECGTTGVWYMLHVVANQPNAQPGAVTAILVPAMAMTATVAVRYLQTQRLPIEDSRALNNDTELDPRS
jgi:hypothetical protein